MKESFTKKVLLLSLSALVLVSAGFLLFMAISMAFKPAWHENIRAQIINEPFSKSITVSAEGKITVKPDIALVNLSVVSQSKNVKTTVKDGNEKMAKVYAAVKEMGIEEKDINSTAYSLYPTYDYSRNYSTPAITGYTLTQEISVKIRNLEIIEDVLDKAVVAGSNQIGQLTFDIDDSGEIKKQAREKAFETAKEKAKDMAKAAGVSLGGVLTFSETTDYFAPRYANYALDTTMGYNEAMPSATIAPGSKEFSVNVSITYSIN